MGASSAVSPYDPTWSRTLAICLQVLALPWPICFALMASRRPGPMAQKASRSQVKCNFVGTALEGDVEIVATLIHGGRTTQLWDADITSVESGRRMALIRATQIILYP